MVNACCLVGYRSRCYDASMRTKITNLPASVLHKLSALSAGAAIVREELTVSAGSRR